MYFRRALSEHKRVALVAQAAHQCCDQLTAIKTSIT